MNWWLLILPLISACLGWCIVYVAWQLLIHPLYPRKISGMSIYGWLPKNKPDMAKKIGVLAASFFPVGDLEEKITHPDNVKKIMPQAEEHIDEFLRVKLVKSMPVVGMFVGDKTINSLKSLFIAELEALFPVIMKSYMGNLQQDLDIEKIISTRIMELSPEWMEKTFFEATRKQRQVTGCIGALAGFLIGAIQLLLMHLIAG